MILFVHRKPRGSQGSRSPVFPHVLKNVWKFAAAFSAPTLAFCDRLDHMAKDAWRALVDRIETKVSRDVFYQCFQPTILLEDTGDRLTVRVPDERSRSRLTRHYATVIDEAAAEVERRGVKVSFVIDTDSAGPSRPAGSSPAPADSSTASVASSLNPRYTFDSFVVGPSNQFAHAAALAVAEAPSLAYNPLYLYGGVGLGKTHLMHAVGHMLLRNSPNLKLTYVTSERFMNEMINAVRYDRMLDFRERYRAVDVIMVDDVQFMAGKDGTQNEFFHTFNALHESQKQIVISSDCPPQEISSLEDRLRSRFLWGLIADIQPPDLETKIAILKKKADAEHVPLPDDVALYIANRIKSNVRELEGSLIRLIAYASLKGEMISLPLAQDVLHDILKPDEQPVTIDMVLKFVANYYSLRPGELKAKNNSRAITEPRQIAMYLCKHLTNASLKQIGHAFGGKHHTTVLHSINKVAERRRTDRGFHTLLHSFTETFK